MLTLPIRDVLPATPRSRIVRLDLGGSQLTYQAGQAVFIGAHGTTPRRPYSLASSPEDVARDGWLELLIGVDEAGHAGPHLPLERGVDIDVEGPAGRFTFPIDPGERRFLFIAGGTGIAPLRAMLHHALETIDGRVALLYSARTRSEFAYEGEMRALAAAGRIDLSQTITRDAADGAQPVWAGGRGRIDQKTLRPLLHDPATLCFICGPPALVDDIPKLLNQLGVSPDRIRIEEWG